MNFGSLIPWREKRPAPVARDQVDPFTLFRREIDRVFEDFFADFASTAMRSGAAGWDAVTPVVDVTESDKEVVVTTELPGLDEKDFEVTLSGDLLTIKGEKKDERERKDGSSYYMERRFGSFSRSVRLPFEASDEEVKASFEKGVLTVHIPKPAEVRNAVRKIPVQTG